MYTRLLALPVLAALAVAPSPAPAADIQLNVNLGLPVSPPLVVVQPGVQVVRDHDDEVFVHGGTYWTRRGDRWYRAPGPRATFVFIETRHVPETLRRLPPGHYRHYHPPPPVAQKLDKKEEKRQRKEQEQARKAHEREHDHDHGHDRGHDHDHDHGHGNGR